MKLLAYQKSLTKTKIINIKIYYTASITFSLLGRKTLKQKKKN